jgi:lipopolysaccharide/colanic/teichoic acid biosynthesis glycosyltransferase
MLARVVPWPWQKRVLDRLVAALLLLVLAPLALVALAAMVADMLLVPADRGPFLYGEPRISRGREFRLLKLRTLRREALARAAGHARLLEADGANLTWAGRRILKPWYLDELPQLLNVLRGDISLVGPRPWPPELVEAQVAEGYEYRLRVAGGLTGPAQVTKGVAGVRYAELDLAYVEACRTLGGWALARHDLGILRRTVAVLARGEGLAY